MRSITPSNAYFKEIPGKTVIVTGAGGGIGAETARFYHDHGAKVVLADLEQMRSSTEAVISSFGESARAVFIPVNILDWAQMTTLFRSSKEKFGRIDIVVANAGVMESVQVLETEELDEHGELAEPKEGYKVIDINLKGTLNSEFGCFQMARDTD